MVLVTFTNFSFNFMLKDNHLQSFNTSCIIIIMIFFIFQVMNLEIERRMHGLEFLLSVLGTMVMLWSVNQNIFI